MNPNSGVTASGSPASGTAPLTVAFTAFGADVDGDTPVYSWAFGDGGVSTLRNPNHTYVSAGSYTSLVTVTDGKGGTTQATVNVTVTAAPVIIAQPVDVTVLAGQSATFSVTATGTAPLTYQWRKNGVNIPGATANPYTMTATTNDNGAQYGVVVANADGSVTSGVATLTVKSGGQSGWWKFDETSGTNAVDSSGNGNTGTLVNCPGVDEQRTNGGALAFNGTNSYVRVKDVPALKYKGGDLTLSAWVYVNPSETNGAYLVSKPWNANGEYNYPCMSR